LLGFHRLIIDLWRSMISGPPIDEQRALRERTRGDDDDDVGVGPSGAPGGDDQYDSDRDPNDIVRNGEPSGSAAAGPDDDSDYGESDSD